MIQDIRSLISLAHLKKANTSGQIATILILMLTGLLIFFLATVNLGKISLNATHIANATDSAALGLASQLATRAHVYSQSLRNATADECGETEACNKRNIWGTIFAIVFAVIVTVITWGEGISVWEFVLIMVAGALGGLVGAAIEGTDLILGALQGAIIGAAIGGVAMMGMDIGAGAKGITQVGPELYACKIGGVTYLVSAKSVAQAAFAIGKAGGAGAVAATIGGATLGVTLVTACKLYNVVSAERMRFDAMAAACKKLNGLPPYDSFREGAFLQVLSYLVDDPNTTEDTVDSDGDGDFTERVPYFQVWWDKRIDKIKEVMDTSVSPTESFLNKLDDFKNFLYDQTHPTATPVIDDGSDIYTPGPFAREEIDTCAGEYKDGAVIELLRSLEGAVPGGVSFWDPGPTQAQLPAIADCETCPEPPGFDEVDEMLLTFDAFLNYVADVQTQQSKLGARLLAYNYRSWFNNFYDPGSADDYYNQLGEIKGQLNGWKIEIELKKNLLPTCVYTMGSNGGESTCNNPPCKFGGIGALGASIDEDIADEFFPAKAAINELITKIDNFQNTMVNYYNQMNAIMPELSGVGGWKTVTYAWTDSLGAHSVSVEVGPFKIASLKEGKKGHWYKRKYCVELRDYSDDGSRTWVKVTRTDPANVQLGILGPWNSSGSTVSRMAKVSYSYNQTPRVVGIK